MIEPPAPEDSERLPKERVSTQKVHFSLFHAGMWGAKALRQLLRGRLFIRYPRIF
jgi:hypothetical protein